jgi:hypothetical protein
MASNGHLAYLISDASICYGTNYPINRVIITRDFSKNHSINTLFQLMGRAGRVGQSWMAEAFIDKDTAHELLDYVNKDGINIETVNMQNSANKYINMITVKDENERIRKEKLLKEKKFVEDAERDYNNTIKHIKPISEIIYIDRRVRINNNWRSSESNNRINNRTNNMNSNENKSFLWRKTDNQEVKNNMTNNMTNNTNNMTNNTNNTNNMTNNMTNNDENKSFSWRKTDNLEVKNNNIVDDQKSNTLNRYIPPNMRKKLN